MKSSSEARCLALETQLGNLEPNPEDDLGSLFKKTLQFAGNLDFFYLKGDLGQKRRLIGSIFPENTTFDGTEHRTVKINEVVNFSI